MAGRDQVVVVDNDHQVDEDQGDDVVIVTASGGRLTPFKVGDPRAVEAGRKGAAVRRARRAAAASSARATASALLELRASFDRETLGPDAAAAGSWLVGRIVTGAIPVRNGSEAADLLRALVEVARLEAGESTSNTVVAHIGAGAAAEVRALRDRARAALGIGQGDEVVDDPPPL